SMSILDPGPVDTKRTGLRTVDGEGDGVCVAPPALADALAGTAGARARNTTITTKRWENRRMAMAGEFVTLDEVRAAGKRLEEVCLRTPVWPSRILSRMAGGTTLLKCENLQRTGSFKIRGAYNRIAKLSPEQRARGVVAASAGNHAQGVALGASLLGVTSTVFMPAGAPLPKVEATGKYGAKVVLEGSVYDEAHAAAQEFAEQTGAVMVHPFDHRDVIAGQGTITLEILEQVPDVRSIIVPVGGGGLVSGIAAAAKALRPDPPIIFPAVVILSGGNIDPLLLLRVIRFGMTSAGRYFSFRTRLRDRPGELQRLSGAIAQVGVNVVGIEHRREGVLHSSLGDVEV